MSLYFLIGAILGAAIAYGREPAERLLQRVQGSRRRDRR